jgi:hypothetical protein
VDHYIPATFEGVNGPDWLPKILLDIAPFIEQRQGPWEAPLSPPGASGIDRVQEVEALMSLSEKMGTITTALSQREFTSEAWWATLNILDLFGSARPMSDSPGESPDILCMAWFVLTRNAAVSLQREGCVVQLTCQTGLLQEV